MPPCPQENRLAQHTIQALQSELDSLRADNIKLFEKIKFLQSYPGRVSALPNFSPWVYQARRRADQALQGERVGGSDLLGSSGPRDPQSPSSLLCLPAVLPELGRDPHSGAFVQVHSSDPARRW